MNEATLALVLAVLLAALAVQARSALTTWRRHRRRARFHARLVAPSVLRLLRERGARASMRSAALDVTAVCCDLRGFTRYTQEQPPEYALQLLRDYYRVVGRVTASFNATVKDFVGDGALILVGAPYPVREHADMGLSLASQLRTEVARMLCRWSRRRQQLGVGLGVASGQVQAAIVASDARYEYVAVGSAVNVASHLCEAAASGEILVAPCTAALSRGWQERLQPGVDLALKGVDGRMHALRLAAPESAPSPWLSPA